MESTEDAKDCPRCGDAPTVCVDTGSPFGGWMIGCDNCYDGAPDSDTRSEYAQGETPMDAAQEWNEKINDGFIGEV